MNRTRDFDRAVDRWLDDGSDVTPPEVIDAVLLAVRSTPQERDFRVSWRTSPMTFLRVAAVIALVAIASTAAISTLGPGGFGFGGTNATRSPSPEALDSPNLTATYASPDGEVSVSAPSTWSGIWTSQGTIAEDVWYGLLYRSPDGPASDGSETIGLVDPVAYDAWCAGHLEGLSPEEQAQLGGPLLSAPADAEAIAQALITDPDFETTAPMAARIGGVEALSVDVTLAPGGKPCGIWGIDVARWVHTLWPESGLRLRLYLVDLPAGMSVQTLAITVVAPEGRFEEFIEETAPIIESIEFHP